jgi:hypothetical protein
MLPPGRNVLNSKMYYGKVHKVSELKRRTSLSELYRILRGYTYSKVPLISLTTTKARIVRY